MLRHFGWNDLVLDRRGLIHDVGRDEFVLHRNRLIHSVSRSDRVLDRRDLLPELCRLRRVAKLDVFGNVRDLLLIFCDRLF